MASKLRNFVLFGAAGSGKGSIASKMVADFGFKHVCCKMNFAIPLDTLMNITSVCLFYM